MENQEHVLRCCRLCYMPEEGVIAPGYCHTTRIIISVAQTYTDFEYETE